jgi:uncharacterized lipoprotein NlpE involved in copper resistance
MRTAFFLILLLLLGANNKAQDVYKTPSGAKYHLASCHMAKNVSEKITRSKAVDLGLQPCSICKPRTESAQGLLSTKKAQGQDETVQCRGVTKSGTRCRHRTRIANGYCFQHNPDKS